jgi:predicted transcriptional regulator
MSAENLMAETKPVFDEIDQDAEARAIAKSRAEIAAGKGVPHEKVREWLIKLRDGKVEPPPCA